MEENSSDRAWGDFAGYGAAISYESGLREGTKELLVETALWRKGPIGKGREEVSLTMWK